MGLCCPRRAQRAWEAAGEVTESRGHSKGPSKGAPRRKGGETREKLGRNLAGWERGQKAKGRAELPWQAVFPVFSWKQERCPPAWLFSQFLFKGSSCLRRGAFGSPFPGRSRAVPGAQQGQPPLGWSRYLIGTAGEPHKWQHRQTPAREAPGSALGQSHSRRSPGAELVYFDFPSTLSRPSIL